MLDAKVLAALERHGVTEEHFTMLLRLLETQKNGHWIWHVARGQLDHCDLRLVLSREPGATRVCEPLIGG